MNAKTLEQMIVFRSEYGANVMKEIIYKKIFYQFSVANHKDRLTYYKNKITNSTSNNDIFLIEALAAKEYWNRIGTMTKHVSNWEGRKPHKNDPTNKLLDIGYHYLVSMLVKLFDTINLPSELGLLHIAQSANSKPLIYDYMEWLRPIVVDRVLIKTLRKKKKIVTNITSKDIAMFVQSIKNELQKEYFHTGLGYCITLEYWSRLNALSLLSGVNHGLYPKWKFPSLRHESRCGNKKPRLHESERV